MKKSKGPAKAQEARAASPVICVMRMSEADSGTLAQSVKEAMGTMEGIAADSGMEGCGVICVLHMGPEGGDAASLIAEAVGAADALDAAEALEAAAEGDGEAAGAEGTDIPDDMEITDMAMRHIQGAIAEIRGACGMWTEHLDLEKASEVVGMLQAAESGLRRHAEGLFREEEDRMAARSRDGKTPAVNGAGSGPDPADDCGDDCGDDGMEDYRADHDMMVLLERHTRAIRTAISQNYEGMPLTWRAKRILKKLEKLEDEMYAHAEDLRTVERVWRHVIDGKMPPEALEIAKGSKGFKERTRD